jgi:uncharacterized protein
MADSSMLIDAHTHIMSPEVAATRAAFCARDVWFGECYSHPNSRFAAVETILESMNGAGIQQAVITGFAFADAGMCAASNDYIIEAVRAYPDRFIGLAAVQPSGGGAAVYEAERCLQSGLSGLGEILPDGQRFDLTDATLWHDLADFLIATNAPVMVHTSEPVGHLYPGKGKTYPPLVLAFAQNFPALKIIAAHWGGGLPFYELMPEVRAALANVVYDTAATTFLYDFRVFRTVADACGAEKILFATDFPLLKQKRLIERVRNESGLTPAELKLVLGANAARLFNR